ncbi:hypothetical protein TNCV_3681071 [Trichonephila clavipes]|uniref:Uncharacterized protein n=1 Tax=Trichonephila clavipes TaxID=2585209 RepID=A0A8X6RH36_TRICX|nr:hypothetical protein TNCV_3681071 [Trichonephila clavipes]
MLHILGDRLNAVRTCRLATTLTRHQSLGFPLLGPPEIVYVCDAGGYSRGSHGMRLKDSSLKIAHLKSVTLQLARRRRKSNRHCL